MENGVSPIFLIAGGVIQIAVVFAVASWAVRRSNQRFSIQRVLWGVFLISLSALPFAAILIWQPPQERDTYRAILFVAVFAPLGVSFLLAFFCIYRTERQQRAREHRGPTTRTELRARLASAPSPNRPRLRKADHEPEERDAGSLPPLPAEFSFNTHEFHQILIFIAGLCFVAGFLAGVIGGHPWRDTISWALGLPAIFTPLFWLLGCRSLHLSYVISHDGVILRRRSRDIEHLSWADIADIRPWPLRLITTTGRRISFQLGRDEMLRARETMIQALTEETETAP